MPAIHLIEKRSLGGLTQLDKLNRIWDSGYWKVAENAARRLVGGSIYLHTAWADPAHFGGTISSYAVYDAPAEEEHGRIIFRFTFEPDHRGVKAPPGGNGEKRFDW